MVCMQPIALGHALLGAGWQPEPGLAHAWDRADGRRLSVLTPDAARGLEWDGVVVVEPAAFPYNRGRRGALYTSLTRANRELVVVHARRLPGKLKSAVNAASPATP